MLVSVTPGEQARSVFAAFAVGNDCAAGWTHRAEPCRGVIGPQDEVCRVLGSAHTGRSMVHAIDVDTGVLG